MRYVGGKSKVAARIAETILSSTSERTVYVEPFVGGGSVLAKLAPHFNLALAGDAQPDLILMWQAIQAGWQPPEITFERYQELRHEAPSAERGFAGFGGSFGGKWFGGFARGGFNGDKPRNHQAESARAVMRIAKALEESQVEFHLRDYRSWTLDPTVRHVIYCDPPYADSTIDYDPGAFDTAAFWNQAAQWAREGNDVFVSEYRAPEGWVSVWSAPKRQSLVIGSGERDIRTEHLWMAAPKEEE